MNRMIVTGFVSPFFVIFSLFCTNFPELSKLPKESKIRTVCEQTPGNWRFLRNATENACDVLNKQMDTSYHRALNLAKEMPAKVADCDEAQLKELIKELKTYKNDFLNLEIHNAIDTILPDEPYIEKIKEHRTVMNFPIESAILTARLIKLVVESDEDKEE